MHDSFSSLCLHRSMQAFLPSVAEQQQTWNRHRQEGNESLVEPVKEKQDTCEEVTAQLWAAGEPSLSLDFTHIFCSLFLALWTCTAPHKSESPCVTPAVYTQQGFHPWFIDLYQTNNRCQNNGAGGPELLALPAAVGVQWCSVSIDTAGVNNGAVSGSSCLDLRPTAPEREQAIKGTRWKLRN